MRQFPPPWTVEALHGDYKIVDAKGKTVAGFKVQDANGQTLAYVYGHGDLRDAQIAKGITLDEARRIASNIAKLPSLLSCDDE
jgi:hypothetical protein